MASLDSETLSWPAMTADQFRRMALKLPEVVESAHMNHPDFRCNGKIFATLGYPGEEWGMVKLTPEQQQSVMELFSRAFQPCKGVWGERGATNVHLPSVTMKELKPVLDKAWKNVSANRKTKNR